MSTKKGEDSTTRKDTSGSGKDASGSDSILKFDIEKLTVVSKEEFSRLQAKHGKLYVLDVEIDEEERYQYIAKRPSKNLISAIYENKDDLTKMEELMLKNVVVAGDMEALEDGAVYTQLLTSIGVLMKVGKSFLSKA